MPCEGVQLAGSEPKTTTTIVSKGEEPGSVREHAVPSGQVETLVEGPRLATEGFPVEEEEDDSA